MKLLLLTDGIYPHTIGGMQKHSYYLGKFLAREGAKVDIVIPARTGASKNRTEDYLTDEELDNIRFLEVDFPRIVYFPGHYIYDSYIYSKNIFRTIENSITSYDYIYSQGYTAWELLRNKKDEYPSVGVNFHGVNMYQPSIGVRSHLEKLLLRLPAKYCLKRADIAYSLGGKLTPLLERFTNGHQIAETSIGLEEKWLVDRKVETHRPRRCVFIGRYEKLKGIELLNDVLSTHQGSEFTFEFIGPIPENRRLPHPSITYHGAIYDEKRIQEILDRSDVLFCPSYSEGMPTVILEAMARGVAVVATDVGAVSCLVNEKTGWLIKAGSLEELHRVFLESIAISNLELTEKKISAWQLIEQNYTWEKVAKRNLEVMYEYMYK